ncbi:MAG: Transposase, family [Bacteroidetes bacterium]|nr:Transposase, family [Bacteroidota bacterium]
MGKCTGVSFIDSTTLKACHIKRDKQNKVFSGIATKGKGTIGWFFGFKLHIIINDKGEILSFVITQGNVDDCNPETLKTLTKKLYGKLFPDKGYISASLFEMLFGKVIHLVTGIKCNMKNRLSDLMYKILLDNCRFFNIPSFSFNTIFCEQK